MSIKIKRYPANNSEFLQSGRTRTQIDIPGGVGLTDLTQSDIVLDMQVNCYTTSAKTTSVLLPCTFGNNEMVGSESILRHSRVVSRDNGLLNERRHLNVIDANLDWYTK